MATLGQLTKVIASATMTPLPSVTVYVRALREGGLLTTGARGVNAPPVTPLDAARILVALLVSPPADRSAGAVRDCEALRRVPRGGVIPPEPSIYQFVEDATDKRTFPQAVARIIEIMLQTPNARDEQPAFVQISFDTATFSGGIETSSVRASYESIGGFASAVGRSGGKLSAKGKDQAKAWEAMRDSYVNPRLSVCRTLHLSALAEVAQVFAEEDAR